MRIIGGTSKGRRLFLPKGCQIRPTSDRVKESLFNILHPVDGKSFLDLFAGSGNVGLEALSRGAAKVMFIEKDLILANAIAKNRDNYGYNNIGKVIALEVESGIHELCKKGEKFDILFADPPYDEGYIKKTLQYLADGRLIGMDGTIVIQHSIREIFQDTLSSHYIFTDQRIYSDTALSFLKLNLGE